MRTHPLRIVQSTSSQRRSRRHENCRFRPPTSPPVLFRREDHDHLTAFHGRFGFDLGDTQGLGFHPLEQPEPQILMRHLAAAEAQSDFHFVALLEKPADSFHLDAVIMIVDSRTQLDFLDFDNLLLFPGFGGFFLLQEAEFAIIEDLADRGIGRRDDFDKIKPASSADCWA